MRQAGWWTWMLTIIGFVGVSLWVFGLGASLAQQIRQTMAQERVTMARLAAGVETGVPTERGASEISYVYTD